MSSVSTGQPVGVRACGARQALASIPAPGRAGRLRLTRRGRLVVIVVTFVLLCAGFGLGRATSSSAAGVPAVHTTVVQQGDTLWSIAARVAPGHDPRVTVDRLLALNHLTAGEVQAGQQLRLP